MKPDIDANRRRFIQASFALALAFALGKMARLLSLVPAPAREPGEGMSEYRNAHYGLSFLYPGDLAVGTFDEGDGAATITFQNPRRAEGFQIFITPYGEPRITDERFKQDVPSGVRKSSTPVTVDGSTGAAFLSENVALGATKEVWFTHGGFLYEITTLAPLGAHLDAVIRTWKFV